MPISPAHAEVSTNVLGSRLIEPSAVAPGHRRRLLRPRRASVIFCISSRISASISESFGSAERLRIISTCASRTRLAMSRAVTFMPAREQELGQRVAEVGGVLIAIVRVARERLAHDRLELGLDLRVQRGDRRHARLAHELDGLVVGLAVEQPAAGEHLPQDDADREHVGAVIDLEPARRLGRQVAELALHDALVGRLDLACSPSRARSRRA